MEDDISFCTQKYWGFEWDEFMRYLPHNWDCVQLHIIGEKYLPVSLTRWKLQNHSAACILINKRYAQKFVDMYMERGKWRFLHRFGYSPDFPIITITREILSHIKLVQRTLSHYLLLIVSLLVMVI